MEQKISIDDAVVKLLGAVRLTTQQVFSLPADEVDGDIWLGTEWAGGSWDRSDFSGIEPSSVVVVHTENSIPNDTAGSDGLFMTQDGSVGLYEGRHEESWYYVHELLVSQMEDEGHGVGFEVKNAGVLYFYLDELEQPNCG